MPPRQVNTLALYHPYMLISLDCEATGLDLVHGAKPFLVTTCADDGTILFWEWDVDPLTRQPEIPAHDLAEISELIDAADLIYFHNSKYDIRALATVGVEVPWHKVRDTLVASHLLATNHGHALDQLCIEYLGVDIGKHEANIREVVKACRAIVKRNYPQWRIAKDGSEDMPSVKGSSKRDEDKPWKNDMWLPRALAKLTDKVNPFRLGDNQTPNQNWLDACAHYANADTEHTLFLGIELERLIRERGYWRIYEHRLELPRIAAEMECYGVTAIGEYTENTIQEYEQHVAEARCALAAIADEFGHKLELAEGATLNDNMRDFFYGAVWQECPRCVYRKRIKHWNDENVEVDVCPKCASRKRAPMRHQLTTHHRSNLSLPVMYSKKSGNASLDKEAMQDYLTMLDEGPALDFIEILADKRLYDTALSYMRSYRRFWVPVPGVPGYYRIHPSLNPCGTDHLRWASNSPNMQNVSGESREISNRACFGPAPGREWWKMDYKSIERRIPAYECGEPKMVEVFERLDAPPYWGNLYLLTASVLYPKDYWPCADVEGEFRKQYPRLYKQAKFFDLAKQYGCGRRKGDMLSRINNSFDLVDNEFPLLAKLQAKYLQLAERTGFVETIPDKDVDPKRGYPILASRTEDGRVLSTTPFNYHTSGTACWAKNMALVRCSKQCRQWRQEGFDAHIALEVHDDILFDFPTGASKWANAERALILKGLMERSGQGIGIPTPVSVELCTQNWAEGEAIPALALAKAVG